MIHVNWQCIAISFSCGMAAGLLVAWAISAIAWRCAMALNITESALKIAENARIQAEILLNERRLKDLKERCGEQVQRLAESGVDSVFAANPKEAHK